MERAAFEYTVGVSIKVTGRELEIIFTTAETHYDGKCKDSARQGGFLWGWRNRLFWDAYRDRETPPKDYYKMTPKLRAGTFEVSASWGELDTVAKILEMAGYQHGAEATPLASAVYQLMRDMKRRGEALRAWDRETPFTPQPF